MIIQTNIDIQADEITASWDKFVMLVSIYNQPYLSEETGYMYDKASSFIMKYKNMFPDYGNLN